MKKELLQDIEKTFPNYRSKKFDYSPINKDLDTIFDFVNKRIFHNKLDKSLIDISIEDWPNAKDKGTFSLSKKEKNKTHIHICRSQTGKDNFGMVVSVLCHEMIHAYDRYYGPLKEVISNEIFSDIDYMEVSNVNGKQLVNGYDAHGKYFMSWVSKFDQSGIIVKVKYDLGDNKFMKKLNEEFDSSLDQDMIAKMYGKEILEETDRQVDNPKYEAFLRQQFGKIKNCKKNFTYIDKDNWVFSMA